MHPGYRGPRVCGLVGEAWAVLEQLRGIVTRQHGGGGVSGSRPGPANNAILIGEIAEG